MAKDPAFLFYSGDWLQGTMGMTFEEKGAYLELLIFQFNNGKFTITQAKQVLSICSTSVFHNVIQKFNTDGTFFWKQRLTDEIERRQKFSESRRNNAKGTKNKDSTPKSDKAYAKHMETENVTETVIKKNKGDVFESLFTDEKFITDLSITHQGKDLKQAFEECYTHHSNAPNPPQELWEWRQKLNTWLTIKKTDKVNGAGKISKRESETIARREAFAKQVRDGNSG